MVSVAMLSGMRLRPSGTSLMWTVQGIAAMSKCLMRKGRAGYLADIDVYYHITTLETVPENKGGI